jgi:tetratricopeptide (TPR) repeat protein
MTPFTFKILYSQFDTSLLPPNARKIGSREFEMAVIAFLGSKYANQGQTAIVAFEDQEIAVTAFGQGTNLMDYAMSLLERGRIADAVPVLEHLNRTSPNHGEVLYNLGIAYSELGQYDEAIMRLKLAVKLDPDHAHSWVGIGVAYMRLGQGPQAIEALERAVALSPNDGHANRNLGAVLANAGRIEEAIQRLRTARRLLPNDPHSAYGLAKLLLQQGGSDGVAEADRLLKQVIDDFPNSPMAEECRQERTRLAHDTLRSKVGDSVRPDVVAYMVGTLELFGRLGPERRQQIAIEIATLGERGLDINNPAQKYALKNLPGKFSGLHLLSIMYVAFQQIDPKLDVGIDFSAEYKAAVSMTA